MYLGIIDELRKYDATIAVIGLGYVGFPLAKAFSRKFRTIGFDVNSQKIDRYKKKQQFE